MNDSILKTSIIIIFIGTICFLGVLSFNRARNVTRQKEESEKAHYTITDLTTGKTWESIGKPVEIGESGNFFFKTTDDTGVTLHNPNITVKRIK